MGVSIQTTYRIGRVAISDEYIWGVIAPRIQSDAGIEGGLSEVYVEPYLGDDVFCFRYNSRLKIGAFIEVRVFCKPDGLILRWSWEINGPEGLIKEGKI